MTYNFDIEQNTYIDNDSKDYLLSNLESGKTNAQKGVLSVSDALLIAKTGLETVRVKIIGEVSQVNEKSSYSAVYFTIKDKNSALPCLLWKSIYRECDFDIKAGAMVEVFGYFSIYEKKGNMNFIVSSIKLAGEGQLRMQVAMLAKKLQNKGLFDASRKKPIPYMPLRIGIVTSPGGDVFKDVRRTLNRRMPIATLVFAGSQVDGVDAHKKMIAALDCINKANVDVVLLVRGGGSYEDLMPFNNEELALKIASLKIPIVTGIGHEPDTTIADLVSDFRASTPTAAAEVVSVVTKDLISEYSSKLANVKNGIINNLKSNKKELNSFISRPVFKNPMHLFSTEFQNIDYLQSKLLYLLSGCLDNFKNDLSLASSKLNDKSPLSILSRGYSIARDKNEEAIKSIDNINPDDNISVEFSDGKLSATVNSVERIER